MSRTGPFDLPGFKLEGESLKDQGEPTFLSIGELWAGRDHFSSQDAKDQTSAWSSVKISQECYLEESILLKSIFLKKK